MNQIQEWIKSLKTLPVPDRRVLIAKLREEACKNSGGHPPTSESNKPELVPVFEAALDNDDAETRLWGVQALAYMNHLSTLPVLLRSLDNLDADVRYYAVMGLRWLGKHAEAKPRIVHALESLRHRWGEKFDVRLTASYSLVVLGELKDPSLFLEALRLEDVNHALAADALAVLKCRTAVGLLVHGLGMNTGLNSRLRDALKAITGADFGEDQRKWAAWLEENKGSLPDQAT